MMKKQNHTYSLFQQKISNKNVFCYHPSFSDKKLTLKALNV